MYDPEGYALVKTTFNVSPENDWRYVPYQLQPSIIAPPAKFGIDPCYSKFTWAREFTVAGSDKASDQALLKANDTIGRMLAYRHDVLKALIADGVSWSCPSKTSSVRWTTHFKAIARVSPVLKARSATVSSVTCRANAKSSAARGCRSSA
jgi:hypothetical protein